MGRDVRVEGTGGLREGINNTKDFGKKDIWKPVIL